MDRALPSRVACIISAGCPGKETVEFLDREDSGIVSLPVACPESVSVVHDGAANA
jgi:hypothetical protein